MPVTAAGVHNSQYVNRNDYGLRCVLYQRGDRNVVIDGTGGYCVIIDRQNYDIDVDDVCVNSSTIEMIWLCSDQIDVKKGSIVVSGGYQYKVKNSPIDNHDGWYSVQLQLTCKC